MVRKEDIKLLHDLRCEIKHIKKLLCGDIKVNNLIPKNPSSSIGKKCKPFDNLYVKKIITKHCIKFCNGTTFRLDDDGCIITTDSKGNTNPPLCPQKPYSFFIETATGPLLAI